MTLEHIQLRDTIPAACKANLISAAGVRRRRESQRLLSPRGAKRRASDAQVVFTDGHAAQKLTERRVVASWFVRH